VDRHYAPAGKKKWGSASHRAKLTTADSVSCEPTCSDDDTLVEGIHPNWRCSGPSRGPLQGSWVTPSFTLDDPGRFLLLKGVMINDNPREVVSSPFSGLQTKYPIRKVRGVIVTARLRISSPFPANLRLRTGLLWPSTWPKCCVFIKLHTVDTRCIPVGGEVLFGWRLLLISVHGC
jgi:hypothetical protein